MLRLGERIGLSIYNHHLASTQGRHHLRLLYLLVVRVFHRLVLLSRSQASMDAEILCYATR